MEKRALLKLSSKLASPTRKPSYVIIWSNLYLWRDTAKQTPGKNLLCPDNFHYMKCSRSPDTVRAATFDAVLFCALETNLNWKHLKSLKALKGPLLSLLLLTLL